MTSRTCPILFGKHFPLTSCSKDIQNIIKYFSVFHYWSTPRLGDFSFGNMLLISSQRLSEIMTMVGFFLLSPSFWIQVTIQQKRKRAIFLSNFGICSKIIKDDSIVLKNI